MREIQGLLRLALLPEALGILCSYTLPLVNCGLIAGQVSL